MIEMPVLKNSAIVGWMWRNLCVCPFCIVQSLFSFTPPGGTCAHARVYRGSRAGMTYGNPNSPIDDKTEFTTNWIQVTITKRPDRLEGIESSGRYFMI